MLRPLFFSVRPTAKPVYLPSRNIVTHSTVSYFDPVLRNNFKLHFARDTENNLSTLKAYQRSLEEKGILNSKLFENREDPVLVIPEASDKLDKILRDVLKKPKP